MDALQLSLLSVLVLPCAVFALLAWTHRARFRALAERLGARHVPRGWLAPGGIVGAGLEIAAVKVGKGYHTRVQIAAAGSPGTFFLDPRFFARFPDWTHAKVPGAGTERVFLWEIRVQRHVAPTPEQRERLLHWLADGARFSGWEAAARADRLRQIVLDDEGLSTSFSGIVSSPERLQRTLELLRQLPRASAEGRALERAPRLRA